MNELIATWSVVNFLDPFNDAFPYHGIRSCIACVYCVKGVVDSISSWRTTSGRKFRQLFKSKYKPRNKFEKNAAKTPYIICSRDALLQCQLRRCIPWRTEDLVRLDI